MLSLGLLCLLMGLLYALSLNDGDFFNIAFVPEYYELWVDSASFYFSSADTGSLYEISNYRGLIFFIS